MKKKSRKIFLCLLTVAFVLLSIPLFKGISHFFSTTAKAQEENGFYYRVEAGNCVIVGVDDSIVFGNVTIPATLGGKPVTGIGEKAFEGKPFTSVSIPKSVAHIGNRAFNECVGLTEITVASENPDFLSENGVLFDKDKTLLLQYPNGNTRAEYTVPQGVREIKEFAFYGGSCFTGIFIPKSVTQIGEVAFSDCDYLKNVSYGGTQTEFNNIKIAKGNEILTGTNITYSQEDPDDPPVVEDYTDAKLPATVVKPARYKNNVTVKISATEIPQRGYLWVDGYRIKPNANGTPTFETRYRATGERSFTGRIEDENGNVQVGEKVYRVPVDTGFFAKISAFFIDFFFNGFRWREVTVVFV